MEEPRSARGLRNTRRPVAPEIDGGRGEWGVENVMLLLTAVAVVILSVLDQLELIHVSAGFFVHASVFALGVMVIFAETARRARAYTAQLLREELTALRSDVRQESGRAAASVSLLETSVASFAALLGEGEKAREVPPDRVGAELTSCLSVSTEWRFRGGSGRWQLQKVLPELGGRTESSGSYKLQILDPGDSELCQRYARYRNTSRPEGERRPDEMVRVREDILACIYACFWWMHRGRLRPEVHLTSLYSPIRMDIGSTGLVLTISDVARPALYAPSQGWFYSSITDDFEQACQELPRITFPATYELLCPELIRDVSEDHVRNMLGATRVNAPHINTTDRPLLDEVTLSEVNCDNVAQLVSLKTYS